MVKMSMMKMTCMIIMVLRICKNTLLKVWLYIHKCTYMYCISCSLRWSSTEANMKGKRSPRIPPTVLLTLNSLSRRTMWWIDEYIYLIEPLCVWNLELYSIRSGEDNCLCKTWEGIIFIYLVLLAISMHEISLFQENSAGTLLFPAGGWRGVTILIGQYTDLQ